MISVWFYLDNEAPYHYDKLLKQGMVEIVGDMKRSWFLKLLIELSLGSITHVVLQEEEKELWFSKFYKVLDLEAWVWSTFFFLSYSDDPIVTSLVKHKEFDELVHWHSHRPLSDDYDRRKVTFDGELAGSAERI